MCVCVRLCQCVCVSMWVTGLPLLILPQKDVPSQLIAATSYAGACVLVSPWPCPLLRASFSCVPVSPWGSCKPHTSTRQQALCQDSVRKVSLGCTGQSLALQAQCGQEQTGPAGEGSPWWLASPVCSYRRREGRRRFGSCQACPRAGGQHGTSWDTLPTSPSLLQGQGSLGGRCGDGAISGRHKR